MNNKNNKNNKRETMLIAKCIEKNNFCEMTDENIVNLNEIEFLYVFEHGWEAFMARMFEMKPSEFRKLEKFIDEIELFTLVYFWYSTNVGLKLEEEYISKDRVDLYDRVWQHLGQYVQCGWPAVKFMKDHVKSERGNMLGQQRYLTRQEKLDIYIDMSDRLGTIRKKLLEQGIEYKVV